MIVFELLINILFYLTLHARLDKTKYLLEVQRLSSDLVELEKQLNIRNKQLKKNKEMLNNNVISSSKYDDELIQISQNFPIFVGQENYHLDKY